MSTQIFMEWLISENIFSFHLHLTFHTSNSLVLNGHPFSFHRLVAYKSQVFYGTWWSTLSGYVNRMRGYYIAKHKLEGYKDGTMVSDLWGYYDKWVGSVCKYLSWTRQLKSLSKQLQKSFYFVPEERVLQMRSYVPVRKPIYCREFPVSWRDIDRGIEEVQ